MFPHVKRTVTETNRAMGTMSDEAQAIGHGLRTAMTGFFTR